MKEIRPLHDEIVVRHEAKATAEGGVVIPDAAKERPQEGEVLAVGTGKVQYDGTKVPLDVRVGDKVLFAKYAGTNIKIDEIDGEEVLIIREDEVLGVLPR